VTLSLGTFLVLILVAIFAAIAIDALRAAVVAACAEPPDLPREDCDDAIAALTLFFPPSPERP
jgi:hypothetical protein